MKTALYNEHRSRGAKLVDFSGWEMPLYYSSILHEHNVVREKVGIFDVSHMGRIEIAGKDAEVLLEYLSTNSLKDKADGSATYTVWCSFDGHCVDDLIIYKEHKDKFFVIVNAGNREKDLQHLQNYAQEREVRITVRYQQDGILAVQGPLANTLVADIFPIAATLRWMHWGFAQFEDLPVIISHTGYTGAGGYEIICPNTVIVSLWNKLLALGQSVGIEPIGLGARDSLRMEMGYALYGHELSAEIAVSESVSAWTIKWQKEPFLGKNALEILENNSDKRHAYGVLLDKSQGVARQGYTVWEKDKEIGVVTSGTFSPTLQQAIAIILVRKKLQEGDRVEIKVRENLIPASVVHLPFIKNK